jgi:hypothetical protein
MQIPVAKTVSLGQEPNQAGKGLGRLLLPNVLSITERKQGIPDMMAEIENEPDPRCKQTKESQ